MDRQKANIVLRILLAIWIIISLVLLALLIFNWSRCQDNVKYMIQLAASLTCTIWLGVYVWKHGK